MSTVSRYEFMGNWLYFWFACITIIGIPIAILYLLSGTVHVRDEVEDAEQIVSRLRSRRS